MDFVFLMSMEIVFIYKHFDLAGLREVSKLLQ